MPDRKPQINFQVEPCMKMLYEEAREAGHWVTRLCAAGLLLMIENQSLRTAAVNRLREWEEEYDRASAAEVRAFVAGARSALRPRARGSAPKKKAPAARKKAKRAGF